MKSNESATVKQLKFFIKVKNQMKVQFKVPMKSKLTILTLFA